MSEATTWGTSGSPLVRTPCPRCGRLQRDWDGVGVIRCACGYCAHLSWRGIDGEWICDHCGVREPMHTEATNE